MAKGDEKAVSDAAFSNAGDDFHLLWGALKALELVRPKSDLTAILPEAPTPRDAHRLDPSGQKLLSIDMTEYFGGSDFSSATTIAYSQLKYSSTRPNANFTITELTSGRSNRKPDGSIVWKLADTFAVHVKEFGRDDVLKKLKLQLVTNRPVDAKLLSSIRNAKDALIKNGDKEVLATQLQKKLESDDAEVLKTLQKSTKLQSRQFCEFLRVLDLETHASQRRRFQLEIQLAEEIGQLGFHHTRDQRTSLKDLIWEYALPGGREPITRDDVVASLGTLWSNLFPAPSQIVLPGRFIRRSHMADLRDAIVKTSDRIVCVHADGGIGKTTSLASLNEELPEDSVLVVFDCYGGGKYANAGELRHQPEHALAQIGNELALATGSAFLINRNMTTENLFRWFREKLLEVSELLARKSDKALAVIVVDAADNSVSAGQLRQQVSFIHELNTISIPENVRIVISCRTERIDTLRLPDNVAKFPIEPFSLPDTREHLEQHNVTAAPEAVAEFHKLTRGIGRLQAYLLERGNIGLAEISKPLQPHGKSLDDVFADWFREASLKFGDNTTSNRLLQAVAVLPRSISVEFLAACGGCSVASVIDFVADLGRGLKLDGDNLDFYDEDFERYLSDTYVPTTETVESLALLLLQRKVHPYAAIAVAPMLTKAGLDRQLIDLVLQDGSPAEIADPVQRGQVFAERARLAIKAATKQEHKAELVQLLIVVGQASKADHGIVRLLDEHPEPALEFGNPSTVQRLLALHHNLPFALAGESHMKLAALMSRSERHSARAAEYLASADAWVREYRRLPPSEERPDIGVESVGSYVEATLRLKGVDAAVRLLKKCRPPKFGFEVLIHAAKNVAKADGETALQFLREHELPLEARVIVIAKLFDAGHVVPAWLFSDVNCNRSKLCRMHGSRRELLTPLLLSLCEAAYAAGVLDGSWSDVLDLASPMPPRALKNYSDHRHAHAFGRFLRAQVLRARLASRTLKAGDRDLLHTDYIQALDEHEKKPSATRSPEFEEVREVRAQYSKLLPVYEYRLHAICRTGMAGNSAQFNDALNSSSGDYRKMYPDDSSVVNQAKAVVLVDAVMRDAPPRAERLATIVTRMSKKLTLQSKLRIARRILPDNACSSSVLDLLSEVVDYAENESLPGSESSQLLIDCSQIAGKLDRSIGATYFDKAAEIAAELDEEAFWLLRFLGGLCERVATQSKGENFDNEACVVAQFAEECHWRLKGWDGFPWSELLKGLSRLAPAVSAVCVSRWDLRNVRPLEDSTREWCEGARASGAVSPEFAVFFNSYFGTEIQGSFQSALLAVKDINRARRDAVIKKLVDFVLRMAPRPSREGLAKRLLEWAKNERVAGHSAINQVRLLAEFLENVHDEEPKNQTYHGHTWGQIDDDTEKAEDADEITATMAERFLTAEKIDSALRTISTVRENGFVNVDRKRAELLLQSAMERINPEQWTLQLDALLQADAQYLEFDLLVEALDQRRRRWKSHPAVKDWFANFPQGLAKNRFSSFFWYDCFDNSKVERVTSLFDFPHERLLISLAKELPQADNLRYVSSPQFYDFASQLVLHLNATEASDTLSGICSQLAILQTKTPSSVSDIGCSILPSSGPALEAAMLWFLFGHPRKDLRWRAAHVLRSSVSIGYTKHLYETANWLKSDKQPLLCHPKLTFFWLSARQWFLLTVDRIAEENAEPVKPLASVLFDEAVNPDTPHAICIAIAKRAALRLQRIDGAMYSEVQVRKLLLACVSPLPPTEGGERFENSSDDEIEGRFDFDTMDTIPYWYEPLSRVFQLRPSDVCRTAERWICDEWGFRGAVWAQDKFREWHKGKLDYAEFSNRHGSQPSVELLSRYLEFHGLQCAAIDLLAIHPAANNYEEDESWTPWLQRWDVADPNSWASDKRGLTPLEKQFWRRPEPRWELVPSEDEFLRSIGLTEPIYDGFLVGHADFTLYQNEAFKHVRINSALVSAETAESLLYALDNSIHGAHYRIPEQSDDLEISEQIGDMAFQLSGWIHTEHKDEAGIEQDDPFRYEFIWSELDFGTRFRDWFAKSDWDGHEFSDTNRGLIGIREAWSDSFGREKYALQTGGQRLWIDKAAMCSFLRETGMSLIVKSDISISGVKGNSEKENGRPHQRSTRLFLFRSDGSIETPRSPD